MSTLHTNPICHTFHFPLKNIIHLLHLIFIVTQNIIVYCGFSVIQRFLPDLFADLTSTFFGINEIFLPHFEHLPS